MIELSINFGNVIINSFVRFTGANEILIKKRKEGALSSGKGYFAQRAPEQENEAII